jgi:hypothetical protein
MLVAKAAPARLVGRQPEERIVVDIDVAAVDVGKDMMRGRMAQSPEISIDAEQRVGQRLDEMIELAMTGHRAMRGIMADVYRQKQH